MADINYAVMYSNDFYNNLSALTHKNFSELERELGFGNGTIRAAVKRNSAVKDSTLAKVAVVFPDAMRQLGFVVEEKSEGSDVVVPESGDSFTTKGGNEMEDLGNGFYRLHTLLVDQKSAAGYLTGWGDQEYLGDLKSHSVIMKQPVRGTYRSFEIAANNESMCDDSRNAIEPGDIVTARLLQRSLWKSKLHFKEWPFWVIVHKTEGITTKQITGHDEEAGVITCHSLNPKFKDFTLHLDDVIQLFNVIQVTRQFR